MAHTKAGGSTKLGRDSISKRLGIKVHDGEPVLPGEIILRQRGTRYLPGANVRRAGDDTLYAGKAGVVKYGTTTKTKFDGSRRKATTVRVVLQ
jgi:large subunit ribosomal protein L27